MAAAALLALLAGAPALGQMIEPCPLVDGGGALGGRVEAFGAGLPVAAAHLALLDEAGSYRAVVVVSGTDGWSAEPRVDTAPPDTDAAPWSWPEAVDMTWALLTVQVPG
jgi:hypothetical protein